MIRIITDSTGDLTPQRAVELGIDVMPLTVHFGADSYRDGIQLTPADFYAKLASVEELPTTSQINPEEFIAKFQTYVDAGDDVLGIFLSAELSGTCQSACIARGVVGEEHVSIVDSRTVTFGLGLLVEEVCRLRDTGAFTAKTLAEECVHLATRVRLLAAVDTLKYLKMGGRISGATAIVGGLLGICPIISVKDGLVQSLGKARGQKAALAWIRDHMTTNPPDLTRGVAFGHTNAPNAMASCMDCFGDLASAAPYITTTNIGCVVGTHAGPGATGLAFFAQE